MRKDDCPVFRAVAEDLAQDDRDKMFDSLLGATKRQRLRRSIVRAGSVVALVAIGLLVFNKYLNTEKKETIHGENLAAMKVEGEATFLLVQTVKLNEELIVHTADFDPIQCVDDAALLSSFPDRSAMLAEKSDGSGKVFLLLDSDKESF
ncbi:hypothetical protein MLD52_22310 [Puniceicoccaceae bacterium K14]|nr:hypothetical protein [Puniceicoccaceae bacterium K14]